MYYSPFYIFYYILMQTFAPKNTIQIPQISFSKSTYVPVTNTSIQQTQLYQGPRIDVFSTPKANIISNPIKSLPTSNLGINKFNVFGSGITTTKPSISIPRKQIQLPFTSTVKKSIPIQYNIPSVPQVQVTKPLNPIPQIAVSQSSLSLQNVDQIIPTLDKQISDLNIKINTATGNSKEILMQQRIEFQHIRDAVVPIYNAKLKTLNNLM